MVAGRTGASLLSILVETGIQWDAASRASQVRPVFYRHSISITVISFSPVLVWL